MVQWFSPPLQSKVEHRAGDTVIAVPAKSGTTWTMNIFHQLRTGGDPNFLDIYAEVPWSEFKERPDQPDEELLERWAKMPSPRGFKTHSQPGDPAMGCFAQFRDDVKYVVVMRNPEEALVSFKPFLESHSPKLWELWNALEARDEMTTKPTFEAFYNELIMKGFPGMPPEAVPPGGLLTMLFFGFINGWWALRHKPNVLLLHYADMKRDHEGSVLKIAKHLGYAREGFSDEQWSHILEYTSFEWMKANEEKFEVATLLPFKLLEKGAMVRKGRAGAAAEDGMTTEIAADVRRWAEMMVPDEAARTWMYQGGAIAPAAEENEATAAEATAGLKAGFEALKTSPRDVIESAHE